MCIYEIFITQAKEYSKYQSKSAKSESQWNCSKSDQVKYVFPTVR